MPVIQAYPNGLTMGTGGGNATPPKRGKINGWTPGAVRRHTRFLYSVDTSQLDGFGYSVTLTVGSCPESPEAWESARRSWEKRLQRLPGFKRLHWVVEWQQRGVPHAHCAVYFEEPLTVPVVLTVVWVAICTKKGWKVSHAAQHMNTIDGVTGWLKYLSKHAARGVKHYQRMGKPAGWESTGRLWGKVGSWPTVEPIRAELTRAQGFRFRRLVRSYVIAQARSAQDWKRVAYLRRILKNNDLVISQVRGLSDWIPEPVFLQLIGLIDE